MTTRVIVCGGRDFTDKDICFSKLDEILSEYDDLEIVSGHARGADTMGEEYAKAHSIPVKIFPADWNKHGRKAGPICNRQMLQYILGGKPLVIAFWDGVSRGTKNMIQQAQEAMVEVQIIHV